MNEPPASVSESEKEHLQRKHEIPESSYTLKHLHALERAKVDVLTKAREPDLSVNGNKTTIKDDLLAWLEASQKYRAYPSLGPFLRDTDAIIERLARLISLYNEELEVRNDFHALRQNLVQDEQAASKILKLMEQRRETTVAVPTPSPAPQTAPEAQNGVEKPVLPEQIRILAAYSTGRFKAQIVPGGKLFFPKQPQLDEFAEKGVEIIHVEKPARNDDDRKNKRSTKRKK